MLRLLPGSQALPHDMGEKKRMAFQVIVFIIWLASRPVPNQQQSRMIKHVLMYIFMVN